MMSRQELIKIITDNVHILPVDLLAKDLADAILGHIPAPEKVCAECKGNGGFGMVSNRSWVICQKCNGTGTKPVDGTSIPFEEEICPYRRDRKIGKLGHQITNGKCVLCGKEEGTGQAPPQSDTVSKPEVNVFRQRVFGQGHKLTENELKFIKHTSDAGAEWPKERLPVSEEGTGMKKILAQQSNLLTTGFNEGRKECLAVHTKLMSEKEHQIELLTADNKRLVETAQNAHTLKSEKEAEIASLKKVLDFYKRPMTNMEAQAGIAGTITGLKTRIEMQEAEIGRLNKLLDNKTQSGKI
jgi:hypothetical protein